MHRDSSSSSSSSSSRREPRAASSSGKQKRTWPCSEEKQSGRQPEERQRRRSPSSDQSALRKRLVDEVARKLQKAVESPGQRGEILRQLLRDIALDIDSKAQGLLYPSDGISVAEQQQRLLSPSSSRSPAPCFFRILADHYSSNPNDGSALLPLFGPLWTHDLTAQIFALLLHKWLYMGQESHVDEIQRYTRAFISGADQIFWIDLQGNEARFASLYQFILNEVASQPAVLAKVPTNLQVDVVSLLSRFFFLYQPASDLPLLLGSIELPLEEWSSSSGIITDIFVTETTHQLQRIKVEPVLVRYVNSCKALKGVELWATTSIRLQVALYSMASPGGPLFPSRDVRRAARAALDTLFPVGRNFRHIISIAFRLFHPYYWPGSLLNLALSLAQTAYSMLRRFLRFFGTGHIHRSGYENISQMNYK